MLLPSEKPGQGQETLEVLGTLSLGVHDARPGNSLNLAFRHFRALGDDVTDDKGIREQMLYVGVPGKTVCLISGLPYTEPSTVWDLKFRTSEEQWSPVTSSSRSGLNFHTLSKKGRT